MSRTFEPKWTPGPWLYRPKSGSWHVEPDIDTGYSFGRAFITTPDACDMEFRNDNDAELIALAPELAAAVLAVDQWYRDNEQHVPECNAGGSLGVLGSLSERLRMIGADE